MKKYLKIVFPLISGILLVGVLMTSCEKEEDVPAADLNYFNHEGHSYLIVKQNKTWVEAAAGAVSLGGYLAEIEDENEQDAIYQAILESKISPTYVSVPDGGGIGYIWIGATDKMIKEGTWCWNGHNATEEGTLLSMFWLGNNTGFSMGYSNWGGAAAGKQNEPDNFTDPTHSPKGQNTAAIGLAKWPEGASVELGRAGEWNDIAETNKIYYVVEFDEIK
jgi:hypothetical protein